MPACRAAPSRSATRPSTTVAKRSARPAASSTAGALADEDTTAERHAELAQVVEQPHRAREGGDAVARQHRVERVVLPVAEPRHRLRARRVLRGALGQVNAARVQEVADAVVARLAVDVREVVGVGVRRPVAARTRRTPRGRR